MNPDIIFDALSDHLETANGRKDGIGHGINDGFQVKCQGLMGPNPRYDEDFAAGLNPDKEILIQHLIGTFTLTDEAKARGVVTFAVGNKSHDGEFVLAQTNFDPSNPVCTECGQPIIL